MEHITIEELSDKIVRLIPDSGYVLYNRKTKKRYSEAVIERESIKYFTAIK